MKSAEYTKPFKTLLDQLVRHLLQVQAGIPPITLAGTHLRILQPHGQLPSELPRHSAPPTVQLHHILRTGTRVEIPQQLIILVDQLLLCIIPVGVQLQATQLRGILHTPPQRYLLQVALQPRPGVRATTLQQAILRTIILAVLQPQPGILVEILQLYTTPLDLQLQSTARPGIPVGILQQRIILVKQPLPPTTLLGIQLQPMLRTGTPVGTLQQRIILVKVRLRYLTQTRLQVNLRLLPG